MDKDLVGKLLEIVENDSMPGHLRRFSVEMYVMLIDGELQDEKIASGMMIVIIAALCEHTDARVMGIAKNLMDSDLVPEPAKEVFSFMAGQEERSEKRVKEIATLAKSVALNVFMSAKQS